MGKNYSVDRRSWFSNKGFQFRFIWVPIVPVLLMAILIAQTNFFIWSTINDTLDEWNAYATNLRSALIATRQVATDTADVDIRIKMIEEKVDMAKIGKDVPKFQLESLIRINVIAGAIILILAVALALTIAIIQAHRIAGPIGRLRTIMRDIGKGNLYHRFYFRQKDELKPMIETDFNQMVDDLHQKMIELQNVSKEVENMSQFGATDPESIDELRQEIQKMRKLLSQFQCSSPPPPSSK